MPAGDADPIEACRGVRERLAEIARELAAVREEIDRALGGEPPAEPAADERSIAEGGTLGAPTSARVDRPVAG